MKDKIRKPPLTQSNRRGKTGEEKMRKFKHYWKQSSIPIKGVLVT